MGSALPFLYIFRHRFGDSLRIRTASEHRQEAAIGAHKVDEIGVIHQIIAGVLTLRFAVKYAVTLGYGGNFRE